MLLKGLIIGLMATIFSCLPGISFSQTELKSLLEKNVDAKSKKVVEEKKKQEEVKVLQDSIRTLLAKDSTLKQQDKEILEQAVAFDTAEFKVRNFTVKERKPKFNFTSEEGWQKE